MLVKGRGRWAVSQEPKLIPLLHSIFERCPFRLPFVEKLYPSDIPKYLNDRYPTPFHILQLVNSLLFDNKPEKGGNPFSVAEPPCISHYKEYLPLDSQPATVNNFCFGVSSDFICWLFMRNSVNSNYLTVQSISFCCCQKLREEQAARLVFERSIREEMERRWQSLKGYTDDEAQTLRHSEQVIYNVLFLKLIYMSCYLLSL